MPIQARIACLAAAAMLTAAPALAQSGSAKEVAERYDLLGTYAQDCNKPVSRNNLYYVNRALDAERVQRDQMSGPTTRDFATIWDQANAISPNEIALGGTRDGQRGDAVFRVEPRRTRTMEATIAGRKEVANGRFASNGRETPWLSKCNPTGGPAASVKEIFEKYGLLGTFAWDCGKPASRQNFYYVHRLIDTERVQRDAMEGPTTRTFVVVIEQAAELRPNEISVSGMRDGKPFSSVYRAEPSRTRVLDATVDGKVEIAGGRFVNGQEFPWANKCGAAGR
jgi:hypothetical protein